MTGVADAAPALPAELATRRNDLLALAEGHEIADAESYERGAELMRELAALATMIEDAFREPIAQAHRAHKAALAARNRYLHPVEERRKALGGRLAAWSAEQERVRRLEQERLLREAERVAAEQRLAEAAALAEAGEEEEAATVLAEPITVPAVPAVRSAVPKVEGFSVRREWRARIVDPAAIPREYLMPDEAKIQAVVRAQGPLARIPGVVAEEVSIPVTRRR